MNIQKIKEELKTLKEETLAQFGENLESLIEKFSKLGVAARPEHLPGRFHPEAGGSFYYVNSDGNINAGTHYDTEAAAELRKIDRAYENCGKTVEEIEGVKARKIKYQEIIDRIAELNAGEDKMVWSDSGQKKYCFRVNYLSGELEDEWEINNIHQNHCQYCATAAIGDQIKEEFGAETIALCFFGVEIEEDLKL